MFCRRTHLSAAAASALLDRLLGEVEAQGHSCQWRCKACRKTLAVTRRDEDLFSKQRLALRSLAGAMWLYTSGLHFSPDQASVVLVSSFVRNLQQAFHTLGGATQQRTCGWSLWRRLAYCSRANGVLPFASIMSLRQTVCAVCSWFVTQKFLMLVMLGIANDFWLKRWLHSSVRKFLRLEAASSLVALYWVLRL